jgi:DNA-binding XRE family transcriptional regulator
MTKELEVTIRISNNRLKERRTKLGYTQKEMALVIGLKDQVYGGYENMSKSPINQMGQWSQNALKVAEYFDCDVEELFPPSILKIVSPRTTRKFDGAELHLLMSSHSQESSGGYEQRLLDTNEKESDLYLTNKAMARLKPIEAEAIRSRFGMDGAEVRTTEQQAKKLGVTTRRMSRIGRMAINKLHKEIFPALVGKDRFTFCYLDTLEWEAAFRLGDKIGEELRKRFPGAGFSILRQAWQPAPFEVRAYGFRQEGIAEVQSQVDAIAQSIFESDVWWLREEKSVEKPEPAPTPQNHERRMVEYILPNGTSKSLRINDFVAAVVGAALASDGPKLVRARCELREDGQLVADRLLASARSGFGDMMGHKPVVDWTEQRTRLELTNGSAIDLVCEEIERRKRAIPRQT